MTLVDRLRACPDIAHIHPDNLHAFAERLADIGIQLDVDLDRHREQWAARQTKSFTVEDKP